MTNLRQAAQRALEALEDACGGRCNAEYNPCFQREVATALRAALAEPEHRSPNELLLDEMLQNCLKINRELVLAIKDIARHPENDEESAQSVARAVLKNAGINQ